MKKHLFTASAALCFLFVGSHIAAAQEQIPQTLKKDSTQVMLHPDAGTIYLDETGVKIDAGKFSEAIQSGKYIFDPQIQNGKLISLRLKPSSQTLALGSAAPGFSAKDLKDHSFDLKGLNGKTVVVNFWYTSCAPCIQEMPELNQLADKYKNDPKVIFLAITYDSPQQVISFLKHKEFNFNIIAGRPDIIKQYHINAYPTSLVIDKTGTIAFILATYTGTNVQQLDGVINALKNKD